MNSAIFCTNSVQMKAEISDLIHLRLKCEDKNGVVICNTSIRMDTYNLAYN